MPLVPRTIHGDDRYQRAFLIDPGKRIQREQRTGIARHRLKLLERPTVKILWQKNSLGGRAIEANLQSVAARWHDAPPNRPIQGWPTRRK